MGMRTSKFMHWQVKGGVHILASQRAISTLIIFTGAIYLHEFQSPHRSINYHKHILYGYMWLYVLGSPIFFFYSTLSTCQCFFHDEYLMHGVRGEKTTRNVRNSETAKRAVQTKPVPDLLFRGLFPKS